MIAFLLDNSHPIPCISRSRMRETVSNGGRRRGDSIGARYRDVAERSPAQYYSYPLYHKGKCLMDNQCIRSIHPIVGLGIAAEKNLPYLISWSRCRRPQANAQ